VIRFENDKIANKNIIPHPRRCLPQRFIRPHKISGHDKKSSNDSKRNRNSSARYIEGNPNNRAPINNQVKNWQLYRQARSCIPPPTYRGTPRWMPLGYPTLDRIRRLRLPNPRVILYGGLANQNKPKSNS